LTGGDICQRAIIYELIANLLNDLDKPASQSPNNETIYIVSQVLKFITEHLNDELSLNDLAKETNLSVSYLCRIFKQHTSTTLKQYINLKRIEKAKQLLMAGESSNAACLESGFHNYSYFFKVFKQITKVSPMEFQAMSRTAVGQ
jgi:AraC-like DNA-binding protein